MLFVALSGCLLNPAAYRERREELVCEQRAEEALEDGIDPTEVDELRVVCPDALPQLTGAWADCDQDGWGDPEQLRVAEAEPACGGLWVFNDLDCDDDAVDDGGRRGAVCRRLRSPVAARRVARQVAAGRRPPGFGR